LLTEAWSVQFALVWIVSIVWENRCGGGGGKKKKKKGKKKKKKKKKVRTRREVNL
jgi:hypothetical protein